MDTPIKIKRQFKLLTRSNGLIKLPFRLILYIAGLGVWLTGGVWLILHYYFIKQGAFGPQVNPLEPWCLTIHGAFAFVSVWIFGLLWGIHIIKLWGQPRRRLSGGILTSVIALLVISGYLLYYVGNTKARNLVSILHWGIGLFIPFFFILHRIKFRNHNK